MKVKVFVYYLVISVCLDLELVLLQTQNLNNESESVYFFCNTAQYFQHTFINFTAQLPLRLWRECRASRFNVPPATNLWLLPICISIISETMMREKQSTLAISVESNFTKRGDWRITDRLYMATKSCLKETLTRCLSEM